VNLSFTRAAGVKAMVRCEGASHPTCCGHGEPSIFDSVDAEAEQQALQAPEADVAAGHFISHEAMVRMAGPCLSIEESVRLRLGPGSDESYGEHRIVLQEAPRREGRCELRLAPQRDNAAGGQGD